MGKSPDREELASFPAAAKSGRSLKLRQLPERKKGERERKLRERERISRERERREKEIER
jgi:hypothetical protein